MCQTPEMHTHRTPLCDIPLDTTWLQTAGLSCDWLRQSGAFWLVHNLHVTIVANTSRTPSLRAVPALCRTLQHTHIKKLIQKVILFKVCVCVCRQITWPQGPVYHSRRFWHGSESHDDTSCGRSPSQVSSGRSVTWSIRHTVVLVRLPRPHSAEH